MNEMNERIENLLDQFDFETVKKVMVALNWKWGKEDPPHVPTYGEMRKMAKEQLGGALVYGFCACGGFEASCVDGVLSLAFVVESVEEDTEEADDA